MQGIYYTCFQRIQLALIRSVKKYHVNIILFEANMLSESAVATNRPQDCDTTISIARHECHMHA